MTGTQSSRNSWSRCEDETPLSDAQAINSVLSQAAASGITVVNGTGDTGSTCADGSANTVGVPCQPTPLTPLRSVERAPAMEDMLVERVERRPTIG